MRAALIWLVVAVVLALGSVSSRAWAYQEKGEERVDYTAYTLRPWELSVGPFKAEAGVPGGLMFGTYLPTWAIGPFVDMTIPTGFVKLRDPFGGPVAASARVTVVYFDARSLAADATQNSGSRAGLLVLPIEATISARYQRYVSQSLLFTYVFASAGGKEPSDTSIRGAAGVSNFSISTMLEVRVTQVFSLTLLARVLAHQGNAHVTAQFSEGSTTVDADLGARPRQREFVACAIPGVAFSWEHVNLHLGLGYGTWWLPIVELPLTTPQIIPDLSFYVRF
ncbi:MAG TPA: hypothetical protein VK550_25260 [Polyangiaceae bacterium]|nr:hypothetical protein [Polyangiaceae bacterium]